MSGNDFIRKLMLASKFMALKTGKEIIAIQKLPDISRSKATRQ